MPPRGVALGLLAVLVLGLALGGAVSAWASAAVALATACLGLAVASSRRLPTLPREAIALAPAWSGLALASIAWSASADAALDGATAALSLSVAWLLGAALIDTVSRRRFVIGLALVGAAVAASALAFTGAGERAAFPFRNPNHLAAWLLLPGALALVSLLWCDVRRRGAREAAFLWFGVVGIIGAGIAATASRGIGLAVAAALGGLMLLRQLGPVRGARWLGGAALLAVVGLTALPLLAPDTLPPTNQAGESSVGLRWAVYTAAARAALEAAPLGLGLGSFASAFEAHRPVGLTYTARFAHSEFLHGLVELGVPFLLLLLVSGACIVRRIVRHLGADGSRVTWGAATALLGLTAHSLVDFPLHVPAIALAGATLLGLVTATQRPRSSTAVGRGVLATLSLLLLLAGGSQAWAALAEVRLERRLAAGEFQAALRAAELGLAVRPARAELRAGAASAAEHLYRFAGGDAAHLERAIRERSRAVEAEPERAARRLERARTLLLARDLDAASGDLEVAERLDPRSPVSSLARARLALLQGDGSAAAGALRRALDLQPHAAARAVSALLADTGDPLLARAATPDRAGPARATAGILARAGYWDDAAQEYTRAFTQRPEDVEAAVSAGRLFLRVGQPAAALAVLERAQAREPRDGDVARLLASARRRVGNDS